MTIFRLKYLFFFLGMVLAPFSIYGDMRVDQQLTFGSIAIKDNSQVWVLKQLSNGQVLVDTNGIVILEPGKVGQYFFYNMPKSTLINISIINGAGNTQFSGPSTQTQFTIEPYLDFNTYTTNIYGEFTLTLPGSLKTSGNGLSYSDGAYYRFFQLNINY